MSLRIKLAALEFRHPFSQNLLHIDFLTLLSRLLEWLSVAMHYFNQLIEGLISSFWPILANG
jgi:hypothetical protein